MATTPIWVPLVVGVLGVFGTIGATYLTQRNANRRERDQWEQVRLREEDKHRREREHEQDRWIRDKRHELYADLVMVSSSFAAELAPLINMAERIWDPESKLFELRNRYFELQYKAAFIAGEELQKEIDAAGDVAENVGHAPYGDDKGEQNAFELRMFDEAFAVSRRLEDAARAELHLPPRRARR